MIPLSAHAKVLFVRTDKIGDVVLTTPAIELLKKNYPNIQILYLCRRYTAPLLENNPHITRVFRIEDFDIIRELKRENIEVSIHFYVDHHSIDICRKAQIKKRIGPFSKLASLLLSQRISQKRSLVKKHEAEYNCDLIRCFLNDDLTPPSKLYLNPEEIGWAEYYIKKELQLSHKPILIHPGSFGSAQGWPLTHFIELAKKCAERSMKVLFSIGPDESIIENEVKQLNHPFIHYLPAGSLKLRQLIAIISQSQCFIANSTGPLHIASALGIKTISFFPNQPLVTSPKRWAPWGQDGQNTILTPKEIHDEVSTIKVENVFGKIVEEGFFSGICNKK